MAGRAHEPGGPSAGRDALTAEEFAVRFQEAGPVLWTVAAGVLGERGEAEDVLQEAAMMALGKLQQFQPGTNFKAWVATFVRNVALNHGRKRQRQRTEPVEPEIAAELLEDSRPADGRGESLPVDLGGGLRLGQDAFDDHVQEALLGLGEIPRAALLLRTILDQSYREIAGVLGIPEGTAMSHVHRARTSMRSSLEKSTELARAHRACPGVQGNVDR